MMKTARKTTIPNPVNSIVVDPVLDQSLEEVFEMRVQIKNMIRNRQNAGILPQLKYSRAEPQHSPKKPAIKQVSPTKIVLNAYPTSQFFQGLVSASPCPEEDATVSPVKQDFADEKEKQARAHCARLYSPASSPARRKPLLKTPPTSPYSTIGPGK